MRIVVTILLALFISPVAYAQSAGVNLPTNCRPSKLADVHVVSAGQDFAGWWWCDSTRLTYSWRGILKPGITPDLAALAYAWAVTGDGRLLDQITTLQENDPSLAALRTAVITDIRAKRPQYVVAKNGTYKDRPGYMVVNGKRVTTASARILVGWDCDCGAISMFEGTTRYCKVGEPLVSVCVPKQ